ncbi:17112_t:CDS:2, partial [Dentiscutata heterogama]
MRENILISFERQNSQWTSASMINPNPMNCLDLLSNSLLPRLDSDFHRVTLGKFSELPSFSSAQFA